MIIVKVDPTMFFKAQPKKRQLTVAKEQIESNRDDMKRRFAQIEAVNSSLSEASRQTQAASIDTAEKLNRLLRIPKKSMKKISSQLTDGLLILNHGVITHVNDVGIKLLRMSESEIIGKKIEDVHRDEINFTQIDDNDDGAEITFFLLSHKA